MSTKISAGFKHGYSETYTTTITRALGPTTATGQRGTLPEPAPDDTNSIWLAPNGSDGNAGTQAAPKLTLSGAISAIVGQTNIQIFRNGYVGELLFSHSGTALTIPVGISIQVEEGEIARIQRTDGAATLNLGTNAQANGLIVEGFVSTYGPGVVMLLGTGSSLQNCLVTLTDNKYLGTVNCFTNATVSLLWSVVGQVISNGNGATCTTIFNHSLVIYRDHVNTVEKSPLSALLTGTATASYNADSSYFLALDRVSGGSFDRLLSVFSLRHVTASTSPVISATLNSCMLDGELLAYEVIADNSTLTATFAINYTKNRAGYGITTETFTGTVYNNTINVSFEIDPAIAMLLVDEAALYSSATGHTSIAAAARLQAKGKLIPGSDPAASYFLNSPLIGAGSAGVDVNPWEESTALSARTFEKTTELAWPPHAFTLGWRFTNQVNKFNVRGNPRFAFDTRRRVFTFNWGDAGRYAGQHDLHKICSLLADSGPIIFYERGLNENLFVDPTTGVADATDGTFDASDNTFQPNISSGLNIEECYWEGYWIRLVDGSNTFDYYIEKWLIVAGDPKWQLADKLGNGWPATGTYDFTIEYIVVRSEPQDQSLNSREWDDFTNGQATREYEDDNTASTLRFPLQGISLNLIEDEDQTTL